MKKEKGLYFLETSALIALLNKDDAVHQVACEAMPDGAKLCTDAICLAEALVKYSDADREKVKREITKQVRIFSMPVEASLTAAQVFSICQKKDMTKNGQKQFIKVDTLIFASALHSLADSLVYADEHLGRMLAACGNNVKEIKDMAFVDLRTLKTQPPLPGMGE